MFTCLIHYAASFYEKALGVLRALSKFIQAFTVFNAN